jgi:hypothetical protein
MLGPRRGPPRLVILLVRSQWSPGLLPIQTCHRPTRITATEHKTLTTACLRTLTSSYRCGLAINCVHERISAWAAHTCEPAQRVLWHVFGMCGAAASTLLLGRLHTLCAAAKVERPCAGTSSRLYSIRPCDSNGCTHVSGQSTRHGGPVYVAIPPYVVVVIARAAEGVHHTQCPRPLVVITSTSPLSFAKAPNLVHEPA